MEQSLASALQLPPPYEMVAAHLRRMIHLGLYRPGASMPPEREHAEQLGVSRVTLRNAIRLLAGEGLVETRRGAHGGAFVRELRVAPERVRFELRARAPELNAAMEFRLINECSAVERAAARIEPQALEELERLTDELAAAGDVGLLRQADVRFHLLIAEAAASPLLRDAIVEARLELFMPLEVLDLAEMRQSSARGHRAIVAALRRGDARAARRAMAAHLRASDRRLSRILADD
ncbi:FadR/GntR family transcriptional regulator [Conexibacter arvalis]|uniref:DNA-binding FadR family transcriptional regulator n=1 Tax=Conexibacter arvalis TaxID=912552 RepID=A0A840I9I2_9ACTN|nr:GntR family transcriptional regulator [Conexibacter arvalis]MBB4660590.1 DNA-binding FadR family transcriptional regulator [Conexibacter arvalis]